MINWFRSKPNDQEVTLFDQYAEASSITAVELVTLLDVALALDRASDANRTISATAMAEIADLTVIYDIIDDDVLADTVLVKIEKLIDVCNASDAAGDANALTAWGIRSLLGL